MRFVRKGETPQIMTDWLEARESADQTLTYDDFSRKEALNDLLREEQKHICCYCQQIISHYQKSNYGGSHNEHLLPQRGEDGRPDLQMEYTNIFACCNYSKGLQANKQHCGEAKGSKIIPNFIKQENCSSFFKYNALGEITPNGSYSTYGEYMENLNTLGEEQKDAMQTIKVLNLNCTYLVTERKAIQTKLFKILVQIPTEKIQQKVIEFEQHDKYYRFIDMLLYYMRQKIS